MEKVKSPPRTLLIPVRTKGAIMVMLWLGFLFIAWKYLIQDVIQYFGMSETVFGRYREYKWWLIGHISGGMLALVIGPFQLWAVLSNGAQASAGCHGLCPCLLQKLSFNGIKVPNVLIKLWHIDLGK